MPDAPKSDVADTLEGLRSTLEAALHLTRDLTSDGVFGRLLGAFRDMPAADRGIIVGAIEREVKARVLSRATQGVTGQSMVPNPHARLYVRAHETGIDRNLLERDEMMVAMARAMRVAGLIPSLPEIHASWREATREAVGAVDDATRTVVEGLMREVLGFIAEARAAERSEESDPPGSSPGTPERANRS
jgi:hypothetical protein